MEKQILYIDLNFIGNKAEKLQKLFDGFSPEPNEYGYFLKFDDYSYIGNKGVNVITNCFENEEHFQEQLHLKLLFNL